MIISRMVENIDMNIIRIHHFKADEGAIVTMYPIK